MLDAQVQCNSSGCQSFYFVDPTPTHTLTHSRKWTGIENLCRGPVLKENNQTQKLYYHLMERTLYVQSHPMLKWWVLAPILLPLLVSWKQLFHLLVKAWKKLCRLLFPGRNQFIGIFQPLIRCSSHPPKLLSYPSLAIFFQSTSPNHLDSWWKKKSFPVVIFFPTHIKKVFWLRSNFCHF